jgi:hypothetical protein
MLKGFAFIFAIVFLVMGISGFIPPLKTDHLLFNLFTVRFILNVIYILTGLIALSASATLEYAKLYFKIFGMFYALIAVLGLALNGHLLVLQLNLADNFFYLIVAIIALYLGFTSKLPSPYP